MHCINYITRIDVKTAYKVSSALKSQFEEKSFLDKLTIPSIKVCNTSVVKVKPVVKKTWSISSLRTYFYNSITNPELKENDPNLSSVKKKKKRNHRMQVKSIFQKRIKQCYFHFVILINMVIINLIVIKVITISA